AELGLGPAQEPGLVQLVRTGPPHRRPRGTRDPGGARLLGQPGMGVGVAGPASACSPQGHARVARLPSGRGRALRAGRGLLEDPLPAAAPPGGAPADHLLADLERAQSEEVLRAEALAGEVRPAAASLTR